MLLLRTYIAPCLKTLAILALKNTCLKSFPSETICYTRQFNLSKLKTDPFASQILDAVPTTHVIGCEPNLDMRSKQESLLASHIRSSRFQSVAGTAEATNLPSATADLAVAAAAFHWFDGPLTRKEILRVVKPVPGRGCPFAIFTSGRTDSASITDPHWRTFGERMRDFRRETCTDYTQKVHEQKFSSDAMATFFGSEDGWSEKRYSVVQEMGLDEIIGRLQSYSTTPPVGTPEYEDLTGRVRKAFQEYERGGKVAFSRDCVVYYGYVS